MPEEIKKEGCFDGDVRNAINANFTAPVTIGTPASASAPGTTGMVYCDGSYAYFCTATNTWVRVAVATW